MSTLNYRRCSSLVLISVLLLPSCATSLDMGAERVQIVTASQKERSCHSLGIVGTEQRLGPNKPSNAMKKAINQVAQMGGNGIFVVSNSLDWAEGASVTAEALKCSF